MVRKLPFRVTNRMEWILRLTKQVRAIGEREFPPLFFSGRLKPRKRSNGKVIFKRFVPIGNRGIPQKAVQTFQTEFPKNDLTIYIPAGIFGNVN